MESQPIKPQLPADGPPVYAHTLPGRPESDWELLTDHATAVATLAAEYARAFDAPDWARLAGLWHDLGKKQPEFQDYLRGRTSVVATAQWA